jgi:hypothetical protein
MDKTVNTKKDRKTTKTIAWFATVFYLILLPFSFMFACATFLFFDNPNLSLQLGLPVIFLYFCVPLSIPLALCRIWFRYSDGKCKESRRYCLLPLCIGALAFLYHAVTFSIFL